MQLTGLEKTLLGFAIALISAIFTKFFISKKTVLRSECEMHRKELSSLKKGQQIQYKMLRAIVTHSDMPNDVKEKILNEE